MKDLIVGGRIYNGVSGFSASEAGGGQVIFPDVSGTTAQAADVAENKAFYSSQGVLTQGAYEWQWRGVNPEWVSTVSVQNIKVSDTTFPSWTPSTTATSIFSSVILPVYAANTADYDYLIRWDYEFDAVYPEGTNTAAMPIRQCVEAWQCVSKRPSNLANLQSSTFNGNACVTLYTAPLIEYYNASKSHTMTFTASYGIYPALVAATFSSSTSDAPNITIKTPSLTARCSTTYFSTATAAALDVDNSTIKITGNLFRTQKGATIRSIYENLIDLYHGSLDPTK